MQRQLIARISALLLLLALAACASHSGQRAAALPQQHTQASSLPSGHGGSHKTGKPYQVAGHWYYPMQYASSYDEVGVASWYGRDFHGKKTANGERYNMHALSAAHKTLPLPTLVRVTNLENGRSVVVRVNDRGPFVKSRLIDLSYAAAKELGYAKKGTARVRVQTLDRAMPERARTTTPPQGGPTLAEAMQPARPASPAGTLIPSAWASTKYSHPSGASNNGEIFVQLGAFGSRRNAVQLRDELSRTFADTFIQPRHIASTTLYRVRIGPFNDMKKIEQTMQSLQQSGYHQAVVIIE